MADQPLTLVADAETDGFLHELTQVFSLVVRDPDTGEQLSCTDHSSRHPSIRDGLNWLLQADYLAFHNGIAFDYHALRKVYPDWNPQGFLLDTLICARLMWPERKKDDFPLHEKGKISGKNIGRHSLEAWGERLGFHKGDFHDFSQWTEEMQRYCERDVAVTCKLLSKIRKKRWPWRSIKLEHDFAWIIDTQEKHGVLFDEAAAGKLYGKLSGRREEVREQLQQYFPPYWKLAEEKTVTKSRKVKRPDLGYVRWPRYSTKTGKRIKDYNGPVLEEYDQGVQYGKVYLQEFNPQSRDQVAERLKTLYGWQPTKFTDGGKPAVDDEVLQALPYEPAPLLAEYYLLSKRIGQLAEGKQALMKHVDSDGRIRGYVVTNGTVTGRCAHNSPNLGQVPQPKSPYGEEFRKLFKVPKGKKLVGVDADGLELRGLGHFLARYDGGEYARTVVEGSKEDRTDVHSLNARGLGFDPDEKLVINGEHTTGRDQAKRFIYAFI